MAQNYSFWDKSEKIKEKAKDLSWNFPEQKTGEIAIIGGHAASFSAEIKISEFLINKFPFIKTVKNYFPDSLKSKLPPLENFSFFESSESGSFKSSLELRNSLKDVDLALFFGDFSKNSETAIGINDLIKNSSDTPLLLTRDALDLTAQESESYLERKNVILLATLPQLQKIFRAVYYPKVLLLSQSLLQAVETLHKFTLTYPITLVTFHEGNIIISASGNIFTFPIGETEYSPISLWSGKLAAKIATFSLFNPSDYYISSIAATLYKTTNT